MALRNLIQCMKRLTFTLNSRRVTTLTSQMVMPQCSRQLPQIVATSPPARLLLTQDYFKPLNEDFKNKDPTEVIQNLDPDMKKKLKIIQLEYEVLLQMGGITVPEKMTDALWLEMLQFTTANARKRHYRYLRKTEVNYLARQQKKQKRMQENQKQENVDYTELQKNTICLFVRKKTMNNFYYSRLAHSMLFGQPIVFDMNFEHVMRPQDVVRLFDQFLLSHGSNKIHRDPFHFVLCNHHKDSYFQKIFDKNCLNRSQDEYLFTLTNQSYLDLYPHSDLVYLTPDAPQELTTFDHNAIYILGGLVDKVNAKPLTLAKAKREKIKMAKLPLDRYLKWSIGNKSLTLNQVVDIMLELKLNKNWPEALVHVPRRKVTEHKRKILRQ